MLALSPAVIHPGLVFFGMLLMGEPVGSFYTSGSACGICWGSGKPFGIGDTPAKVYLTWTGLVAPFLNGNKTFIATQNWLTPCMWQFDDGEFIGNWTYQPAVTSAVIQLKVDPATFILTTGGVCTLSCVNAGVICTIS